jgi:hypothetical protein
MNKWKFFQCIFSSSSYVSKTRLLMMTSIFIMFILFGNLCYRMINSNPHFPLHRIQVIHVMGFVESKKWWIQGNGSVSCFCLDKSRQRHLASFVSSLNPGIFNNFGTFTEIDWAKQSTTECNNSQQYIRLPNSLKMMKSIQLYSITYSRHY